MRDPGLRAAVALLAATLTLALSACGSDDEPAGDRPSADSTQIDPSKAPRDATHEEECAARKKVDDALQDPDVEEVIDGLHAAAAELVRVGTPENLTDLARHGFETYVSALVAAGPSEVRDLKEAQPSDVADALDVRSADEDAVKVWLAGRLACT